MSGLTEARELKEQRRKLAVRQREILAQAESEDRDLNAEEDKEFKALHDKQEELGRRSDRIVALLDREKQLEEELRAGEDGVKAGKEDTDPPPESRTPEQLKAEKRERVDRALRSWTLRQDEPGDVEALKEAGFDVRNRGTEIHFRLWDGPRLGRELRARKEARTEMGVTTGYGGDTIPQTLVDTIEVALLDFGGMRQSGARIVRTAAGEEMTVPTSDDTGNSGRLLAENTQVTETDITTSYKRLDAYKYSSDIVLVGRELLQDTAVDMPAFIGARLGERLGRITNEHFTTGTGSSQPNGVVTGASSAATTADATTVSYEELQTLIHSIDPAYRRMAPSWMFSDATLLAIKKLKDGDGRPLWVDGLSVREPDMLAGYPYTINQDVADIAASAKAILFGAFQFYWIRDVLDVILLRLDERYADYYQVGWVAFSRHDGELVSAASPIKYLTQSA